MSFKVETFVRNQTTRSIFSRGGHSINERCKCVNVQHHLFSREYELHEQRPIISLIALVQIESNRYEDYGRRLNKTKTKKVFGRREKKRPKIKSTRRIPTDSEHMHAIVKTLLTEYNIKKIYKCTL